MNNFVRYGLIGGIVLGIVSLISYFISLEFYAGSNKWLAFLIPILFMVLSGLQAKKERNGFITFKEAFRETWLTYVIIALVAIIVGMILTKLIDPDLTNKLMEIEYQKLEDNPNMTEEQIEQAKDFMGKLNPNSFVFQVLGYFVSLIFGAIIAAIISAILQKKRNEWDTQVVDNESKYI